MKCLAVAICVQFALAVMVFASSITIGDASPEFEVYSTNSSSLHSSSLKGNVLVITYETKDVVDKNKAFKDRVLEYLSGKEKNSAVTIVPVINCSKYPWLFKNYCIAKVQENAHKLGIRLYDDRSGEMYDDFGIRDNESNVFVVDKKGVVAYLKAGKLSEPEIDQVMELIQKLATP